MVCFIITLKILKSKRKIKKFFLRQTKITSRFCANSKNTAKYRKILPKQTKKGTGFRKEIRGGSLQASFRTAVGGAF